MNYHELYDATQKMKGESRQYSQFMKDFPEYSLWLAERFGRMIDESKMTVQSLANLIGLSPTLISRNRNVVHGYGLNLQSTKILCYDVFRISIHQFLSGEVPTVHLPKTLSLVVTALDRYADGAEYKTRMFNELRKVQFECIVEESSIKPSETTDICSGVFGERLLEYCSDRYINYVSAIGCSPEKNLQTIVRTTVDTGKAGQKTLRLSKGLYIAMATGVPIDYFAVKDYTQYAALAYEDSITWRRDAKVKPVTDKLTTYILGALLSLPVEERGKYVARILEDTWVPGAVTTKKAKK